MKSRFSNDIVKRFGIITLRDGSVSPRILLFIALLGINVWLFNYLPGNDKAVKDIDLIPQTTIGSEPQIPVMLYFSDAEGMNPAFEDRRVTRKNSVVLQIREVLTALAEGPQSRHLERVMPDTTKIRAVYLLDEGLVYVDFTSELRDGHISGTTGERLTVQCIVNTLCELPGIKRVKILIQGEEVDTLKGHISLVEPLSASRSNSRS